MVALSRALKKDIDARNLKQTNKQKEKNKTQPQTNPKPALDKIRKVTIPEKSFVQSSQKCKNSNTVSARVLGVLSGCHIPDKYAVVFL